MGSQLPLPTSTPCSDGPAGVPDILEGDFPGAWSVQLPNVPVLILVPSQRRYLFNIFFFEEMEQS